MNNPLNIPPPPKRWRIVKTGEIKKSYRIWNFATKKYDKPVVGSGCSELGLPVEMFWRVIRRSARKTRGGRT